MFYTSKIGTNPYVTPQPNFKAVQTKVPPINDSTQTDRVELTGKKKTGLSTGAKIGIGAGIIVGAAYSIKKFQVKNIKNIQKAFQETFMRDDITVDQARAMLNRYKEIEKIADDKEYAKALFEEAKKNFGLEKSDIKLVFKDKKGVAGSCKRDNSAIIITPRCSRSFMLDAMHHEFRHAKQHNAIFNLYPEQVEENAKALALAQSDIMSLIREEFKQLPPEAREVSENSQMKLAKEAMEKLGLDLSDNVAVLNYGKKELEKRGFDLSNPDIKHEYDNIRRKYSEHFIKEEVPEKYKEWARKCKDGHDNYVDSNVDFKKYYNNYIEIDARKAGRKIEKFVRGKAFGNFSDWSMDLEYLTR